MITLRLQKQCITFQILSKNQVVWQNWIATNLIFPMVPIKWKFEQYWKRKCYFLIVNLGHLFMSGTVVNLFACFGSQNLHQLNESKFRDLIDLLEFKSVQFLNVKDDPVHRYVILLRLQKERIFLQILFKIQGFKHQEIAENLMFPMVPIKRNVEKYFGFRVWNKNGSPK